MLSNCDAREELRVPWTARRSNQAILKEISPEYSLERPMLKLKLHYFGHLMRRTDSFEKTQIWERLKAGGEGDDRGWDGWMSSVIQWTWVWQALGYGEGQGSLVYCSPWGRKKSDMTEPLNNKWCSSGHNRELISTKPFEQSHLCFLFTFLRKKCLHNPTYCQLKRISKWE